MSPHFKGLISHMASWCHTICAGICILPAGTSFAIC